MQRVAETLWDQLSRETKLVSYERRLQRFVANERIEVQACWQAFLAQVLPYWHDKPVTLILDLTPYTDEMTIVYVGIVMHSRVLPVAWCVMPQQETWERGQWEIVGHLFDLVSPYLSSQQCPLLADRGLISDQPASHKRVNDYRKRMRVEATFQDKKSRGYLIEASQFKQRAHLERWLLVVSLALWWVAHLGSSCIHHGHRAQVDRSDRRDKGLFRIGRLWLKVILKEARRDLRRWHSSLVAARLANCLPFSHRNAQLYFAIHL